MDKNQIKEKRKNLLKEFEEKSPGCLVRKKIIFYLLLAMVASRLIFSIMNAIYCIINGLHIRPFEYAIMFFIVMIALLFSFLIYLSGIIQVAYLAIFGGIYSFYNAYRNGVFLMVNTQDIFLNVVNIMLIITIIIQIIVMVFIVLDKKCKVYLNTMSSVQKELTTLIKNQQNKGTL